MPQWEQRDGDWYLPALKLRLFYNKRGWQFECHVTENRSGVFLRAKTEEDAKEEAIATVKLTLSRWWAAVT